VLPIASRKVSNTCIARAPLANRGALIVPRAAAKGSSLRGWAEEGR
jgi:hypothetical protein